MVVGVGGVFGLVGSFGSVSGFLSPGSIFFSTAFSTLLSFTDFNLVSQQHCSKLEVLLQKKLLTLEGHCLNTM